MFDPYAYSVVVRRAVVDGDALFEATVRELPDVRGYGTSFEEAYREAIDAIEGLHDMAKRDQVPFPESAGAAQAETFSGRITLRLPTSLHRVVAETADRQQVSLNSFISTVLAFATADMGRFFETRLHAGNVWIGAVGSGYVGDATPLTFGGTNAATQTLGVISDASSGVSWAFGGVGHTTIGCLPLSGAVWIVGGVGSPVGATEYAQIVSPPDYVPFLVGGNNKWEAGQSPAPFSYRASKRTAGLLKGTK
jgi:predicted HicB family RNase H-like nuclease